MPLEFRRPEVPDLTNWIEATEANLVERVERGRAAKRHGLLSWPAARAVAAVAVAAIVMAVPISTADRSQPAPDVTVAVAMPERTAPPVDLGDTIGQGRGQIPLLPVDSMHLTADMGDFGRELISQPASDPRAVTTPDGGGPTQVPLRQGPF